MGIAKHCRLYGPWQLFLEPPSYRLSHVGGTPQEFHPEQWLADGFIVSRPEIPPEIIRTGLPIIGIDVRDIIPGMPNIIGDSVLIAQMAANHFLSHGFRRFSYCGYADIRWSRERGESFIDHLADAGYSTETFWIPEPQFSLPEQEESLRLGEWLRMLPKPRAVLVCNDDLSREVLMACQIAGIRVPDEVAILGVDNDKMICLLTNPPLSSIALDFEQAGFEAARLLDQMMSGAVQAQDQRITLNPTHLCERLSTDVMAVEDADIANALRYIREHAKQVIQVDDVVHATTISRRSLQMKFQQVLGRTINDEIRRARINHICYLLTETNLSITQIALELGYSGAEHISRFFSAEKGMTAQEYRNRFRAVSNT